MSSSPKPSSVASELMKAETVADLTEDHAGWLIKVEEPERPGELLRVPHRTYVLGKGIRRWTRPDGTEAVGLLDTSDAHGCIAGTERAYAPTARCEVLRQVKKSRGRRPRLSITPIPTASEATP